MKLDPNFTYILNKVSWPLALPLVNGDSTPCGIAVYAYRCEYCLLSDHSEHAFIYYVLENKWFKLRCKLV